MKTLNRSAFIIRPRKPFLEWASSPDDQDIGASDILEDHISVYLVPEDEGYEEETAPLEYYYEEIFELELESWCADEDSWPTDRDINMFMKWFEIDRQSLIVDLSTEELKSTE